MLLEKLLYTNDTTRHDTHTSTSYVRRVTNGRARATESAEPWHGAVAGGAELSGLFPLCCCCSLSSIRPFSLSPSPPPFQFNLGSLVVLPPPCSPSMSCLGTATAARLDARTRWSGRVRRARWVTGLHAITWPAGSGYIHGWMAWMDSEAGQSSCNKNEAERGCSLEYDCGAGERKEVHEQVEDSNLAE